GPDRLKGFDLFVFDVIHVKDVVAARAVNDAGELALVERKNSFVQTGWPTSLAYPAQLTATAARTGIFGVLPGHLAKGFGIGAVFQRIEKLLGLVARRVAFVLGGTGCHVDLDVTEIGAGRIGEAGQVLFVVITEILLGEFGQAGHDRVFIEQDIVDAEDRKSTRLNSSHVSISYAVFC